jgi:hypothetical protein
MPPRGRNSAERDQLIGPQRCRPNPTLVSELPISSQKDARMERDPTPLREPPMDLPRAQTRRKRLPPTDHPGLPPKHPLNLHPTSIAAHTDKFRGAACLFQPCATRAAQPFMLLGRPSCCGGCFPRRARRRPGRRRAR